MDTKTKQKSADKNPKKQGEKVIDERTKLDLDIAKAESEVNGIQRRNRYRIVFVLAVTLAATLILYFMGTLSLFPSAFRNPVLPAVVGISYGLMMTGFVYFTQQSRISSLKADLDLLYARKRILYQFEVVEKSPTEPTTASYFDSLVRINVENLAEYYSLVKIHTDNSFRISIIAGIIGFILITMGLAIGFLNDSRAEIIGYISSGSGVIIEFIAGVFFYLYNKTVIRLKEYHDSLLAVQNILLSFKIVGDIQDEKEKGKMMGQMLGFLIGKKELSRAVPTSDGVDQTSI